MHPLSSIHPRADIGADVSVGAFSVIGPDVIIGDRCVLASNVVIEGPTEIGPDNRIAPFASIGGAPQDLKYNGEPTRLEIGAGNTIREYVTINRGTVQGGGVTRIGSNNLFMAQAHVAHDCLVGSGTIFANAATLAGHVEIADCATIGAYSGVHQFCRVGREAFIGGYSVVTQDALPWVTTVGNRANAYGINVVGMRRRGHSEEVIRAVKAAYRILFRSKLKIDEAVAKVRSEMKGHTEVTYLCDFVEQSERGVCR